ncbi:Spo0E family sporulation regulatory protein-aspartic acid phosphatase [Thalassorhabdus alkalitolerans]|uniref:Spo0E family sporulation regulatory protein-aspartic acid phosphatase n=1 Tax=Thalassorhabdus alkalitolerans TaxID=2282697 RepID=A0ABW0YTG3_9BACI|nr:MULTISPECIES: aspartyl-phosphate phosphatase Spo0E family protein [Bacillaceae]
MNERKYLLQLLIKLKRKEMLYTAKRFGLTHTKTVTCSQKLDVLLNEYQGIDQTKESFRPVLKDY